MHVMLILALIILDSVTEAGLVRKKKGFIVRLNGILASCHNHFAVCVRMIYV